MEKTILMVDQFSEAAPIAIDILDSKSFYYNFDLVETKKEVDGKVIDGFIYKALYIEDIPSRDVVLRAWLNIFYPVDQELKLLNNYNAFMAGLITDPEESARVEYENYLVARQSFKETLLFVFTVDKRF